MFKLHAFLFFRKKTPEISNSDFISANPRFFLSFLLTTRVRKHHVIFTNTFRRKGKLRSKEATRPLTYFLFTSSVFVLYKTSQKKTYIFFYHYEVDALKADSEKNVNRISLRGKLYSEFPYK